MSGPLPAIDRKVLSEAFQEAMEGWRLRSAVFLTFGFNPGFFEQEILPVFFDIPMSHAPVARVLHLADALRETGPIAVYYDRRALEPGAAPARTDFQRIGLSHRTGYFHPKNVFLLVEKIPPYSEEVKERQRRLIVASLSANLTRSGWWENVEGAHIETAEEGLLCGFRNDILALISLLRRISPVGSDHAALDALHAFTRELEQDPQRLFNGFLVPRLFTGDTGLRDFLESIAGHRLSHRCLEVISPYFDDKESVKPLRELIEAFRPKETRVFLPRGPEGEALCSEQYWNSLRQSGAMWGTLPRDIIRLSRDTDRFVHAKVYRFFDTDDRRETYFIGSVNLTNAGFGRAGNVESGFLVEREGKRKSEWWLEIDKRHPAAFISQNESDNLIFGPGANLVLRFNWSTGIVSALWDSNEDSPRLVIRGTGVTLGEIEPLTSRQLTAVNGKLAENLREYLVTSSFVSVCLEGAPDAVILVEEESAIDKPSLLSTLSPEEILRYWSLLSDAQKQEFFETHAGELNDEELARWMTDAVVQSREKGIFGTFAHVYLSFGNLERTVRKALEQGRHKEAVDRLFGKKFDSLRRLVERVSEKEKPDPVRDYVTLLCAIQLLEILGKDEPDFYSRENRRFTLVNEARSRLEHLKMGFTFADERESHQFFEWFERWFLRRAVPSSKDAAA